MSALLAGRYRLGEMIGSGGLADVWRAWDVRLGRPVAVKRFRGANGTVDHKRFGAEAQVLAGLHHPGLISVLDSGSDGDAPYLVLDLVNGPDLRRRLDDGPLDADRTAALGARVADALAHVHRNGIVHRDVKPANILLDPDGFPRLADFGLAHLPGAERLTASDHMVGTAAYLSPEQVRGDEVTPAADVYALGLVLVECLTGRTEYPGTAAEAAVARLSRPPRIPPLDGPLARLLPLMTSLVARRRPSAARCAEVLADDTVVLLRPPPTRPARRPVRRAPVAALAVGVTAAAAGALWYLSSGSPPVAVPPGEQQAPASTSAVGSGTTEPPTGTSGQRSAPVVEIGTENPPVLDIPVPGTSASETAAAPGTTTWNGPPGQEDKQKKEKQNNGNGHGNGNQQSNPGGSKKEP